MALLRATVCRLLGHRPRYRRGAKLGPRVYASGFRYCGRCGYVLEGDVPRVGDRMKP